MKVNIINGLVVLLFTTNKRDKNYGIVGMRKAPRHRQLKSQRRKSNTKITKAQARNRRLKGLKLRG